MCNNSQKNIGFFDKFLRYLALDNSPYLCYNFCCNIIDIKSIEYLPVFRQNLLREGIRNVREGEQLENYTKYRLKSTEELTRLLTGLDQVFVVSCNKCFKEYDVLQEQELDTFVKLAKDLGKTVTGTTRVMGLSRLTNGGDPRYVGAVVSSGYDARVNRATNDIRMRFGALSYGWIALRELAGFSPLNYRLVIDGEARELKAMLVAVCNTGIFGGGMQIAPEADAADGLLDVTIIHEASRGKLLRLLPTVYSGGFVTDPVVEQLRARRVEVDGDGLFLMGDGEEMGDVPATVECVPQCLRVIVG